MHRYTECVTLHSEMVYSLYYVQCCCCCGRPYFTVWVTSVQIIIFIVTVSVHGIAPLGVQNSRSTQVVTLPCCCYTTLELSPVYTAYGAVRRRTHVDVRRRSPYDAVRLRASMYGDLRHVRRHRTLQMLNYMLLTVVVNGHNRVAYGDGRQRNVALEINVLDYNVAVRRLTVPYGDVRRRTWCERGFRHLLHPYFTMRSSL